MSRQEISDALNAYIQSEGLDGCPWATVENLGFFSEGLVSDALRSANG